MYETLLEAAEQLFPKKAVLTAQEICQVLNCEPRIVDNWVRRSDPSRRPPRLLVGKELRFPTRSFFKWLVEDQGRGLPSGVA